MREKQFTQIEDQLKAVFSSTALNVLNASSGFVIRRRTIMPDCFLASLLKSLGTRRVESIADLVRDFNYDHELSVCYKPYYDKLDTPGFPKLMRAVFETMLKNLSLPMIRPLRTGPFARFRDILIQDGSSFALHDALVTAFPGRFTEVSPAAVEIHVTMSLFADSSICVDVAGDSECERHFLPPAESMRDILILGDRGYDSTQYMRDVENAGGCYIFRIRKSHQPVVSKIHRRGSLFRKLEGKPLPTVLRRLSKETAHDLEVCWQTKSGTVQWKTRLVTRWNPRDKEWVRLMTNLPREDFPPERLLQAYRLRWQIELLFKELKSYSNLHKFVTTKATIAEGLVWASLCVLILKRYISHACEHVMRAEPISTRRVSMCGHMFLPDLCLAITVGLRALRHFLARVFAFLQSNAKRTNRQRERVRGRLAFGLELVAAKA